MKTQPVYILIVPHVLVLDLAGIAEAFRVANTLSGGPLFDLHFIGSQPEIGTSLGFAVAGIEALPEAIESDAWLIALGVSNPGANMQTAQCRAVVGFLRRFGPGRRVMSVCAGALLLAQAGLLTHRQCTTHHAHMDELRAACPEAHVLEDRIFVEDGPIMTSAGVTAGIDLALHCIGQLAGLGLASRVARDLVVYQRRNGGDPQLSAWVAHRNHMHPAVHRAQEAILTDPTSAWTLERLATAAKTSARNLSRLFMKEAGLSPMDYVTSIRVELAREQARLGDTHKERLASRTGFSSAQQMRRAFKRLDAQKRAETSAAAQSRSSA